MTLAQIQHETAKVKTLPEKFEILRACIATIPDAMSTEQKHPCADCGTPFYQFATLGNGRKLWRHEPGGCRPQGQWVEFDE